MAQKFPVYKDESGVAESNSVSVFDETTTPSNEANRAKLYAKDVGGVSKMHALDSDGTEIELGTGSGGGASSIVTAPGPQHSNTDLSPIVQYTLNGVLTDGSGNGHDLSVEAGTENYSGQNHVPGDAAAHFDGATRLSGGSVPALALTGELTIMFWVCPETVTPSYSFIAGYAGGTNAQADNAQWIAYIRSSGRIELFQESGTGTNNSVTSPNGMVIPGVKNFITITRDSAGTGVKIYVNGVEVHSGTAANAPDGGSSATLKVGSFNTGTEWYTGAVWDLLVTDTELTAAQVLAEYQRQLGSSPVVRFGRALPGLEHNPLGLYLFQGDGTDSSGNGRDLSNLDGTPTYGDGFVGLSFEQDNNVGLTRTDSTFEILGAISVYAIVKLVSTTNANFTVVCYDGGDETEANNNLWSLDLISTGGSLSVRYFHEYGAGNNELLLPTGIGASRDEWIMVGWTRDSAGTGVKIFLNGEVIGSTTLTNAPTGGTTSDLVIGRVGNVANLFTGKISAVKIVGSELTEAEMKTEYERCFGVGDGTGIAHQSLHLSGGTDEIDGDQLDIDWDPTNYTPITTPTEVSSVDHLTAHLAGVDAALALLSGYFDETVQTADATVTTIHTIPTTTNQCTYVEVTVQARDNTANETAFYKKFAAFDNAASTVTQQGSTTSIITDIEDDASWDVTLTISGTDILVRVTGDATNTVEWRAFGFVKTHG